jgi:hypothetical protein
MQMWVMLQILAPGMQQRNEADLSAQVFGSGGNCAQCFGGGVKQDVVDHGFILVRDGGDLLGYRENNVEVFNRYKVGLAIIQPLCAHQ